MVFHHIPFCLVNQSADSDSDKGSNYHWSWSGSGMAVTVALFSYCLVGLRVVLRVSFCLAVALTNRIDMMMTTDSREQDAIIAGSCLSVPPFHVDRAKDPDTMECCRRS